MNWLKMDIRIVVLVYFPNHLIWIRGKGEVIPNPNLTPTIEMVSKAI